MTRKKSNNTPEIAARTLQSIRKDEMYLTRDLMEHCSRKELRRFHEALEAAKIKLKHIGSGLALVRGQDIWDSFEK